MGYYTIFLLTVLAVASLYLIKRKFQKDGRLWPNKFGPGVSLTPSGKTIKNCVYAALAALSAGNFLYWGLGVPTDPLTWLELGTHPDGETSAFAYFELASQSPALALYQGHKLALEGHHYERFSLWEHSWPF